MERIKQISWLLTLLLVCIVPAAMAGPPLLCHPFEIGNARSLPWQSAAAAGWNAPRSDYDSKRLVGDTLALLGESTPVIVRMETLRRAAIYGTKDNEAARQLLEQLKIRADRDGKGNSNPLALFDYGYLIETMKQVPELQAQVAALNGYDLVKRALEMRGNDPGLQFAAALVSSWPRRPEHGEQVRKAVANSRADPLLAKNVAHLNP